MGAVIPVMGAWLSLGTIVCCFMMVAGLAWGIVRDTDVPDRWCGLWMCMAIVCLGGFIAVIIVSLV